MKTKTIKYKVTFEKAPEYDTCYKVSLTKPGLFNFKNRSYIFVTRKGFIERILDPECLNVTDSNFDTWCDRYMNCKFNKDLCPCISRI